ncbi:MAG: potassium channel protein [Lachnospiraceae bacterium]|nr:potassium channel protein [Lachnospiraceae bacterium]
MRKRKNIDVKLKKVTFADRAASLKKRIFKIIQIGSRTDVPSLCFDIFIVLVILVNISITVLQTFEEAAGYAGVMEIVEFITMAVFLVEYILRIWTADCLYPEKSYPAAVLGFALSFYGVVDLLTILPYFCPFFIPSGAVVFRMLRVVRILHLFRINSRYDAFNVITEVLRDKRNALVSSIFLVLVLMLASSLCMYGLEHEAQPDNFSNAFSGIWWSMSTLLTVGYGDIYPVTIGGRIMTVIIAFLGVGLVAIPTGIISAGFVEYYTKIKVGSYSQHDADFITLNVAGGHPYTGLQLKQLQLPQGLYPAVVLRGEDVYTPHESLVLEEGDSLLLGTVSVSRFECRIEEVCLEAGHSWIGYRIKELDISRRVFVVMVKRGGENICPQGSTLLQEGDVVLLLEKMFKNQ